MSRYIKYILLIIAIFSVKSIYAQDDCILKLNEAEKLYDDGKIEKIPSLLSNCIESGFNRENKIRALRLLTLVNLFEDNTIQAEKSILRLLKIDPEYKANKAVDPVEFIRLFNSFSTAPVFSLGVIGGLNFTKPHLIETFSFNEIKAANPKYTNGIGFSFGLKANYHINNIWDITFEPNFAALSYKVKENSTTYGATTITESMNYIELPVLASYCFYKKNKYNFYGEAGFSYGLLLSGKITGQFTYNNNEQASGDAPKVLTPEIRKKYNFAGTIGAGTKINLNRSNIQISLRYKIGLMNVVNNNTRVTDHEGLNTNYRFIDNDITVNNIYFMISYNREFYIHKKKPNNKTNYDVIK